MSSIPQVYLKYNRGTLGWQKGGWGAFTIYHLPGGRGAYDVEEYNFTVYDVG